MEGARRDASALEHLRLVRSGGAAMVVAGLLVLATIPLIPLLVPSLAPATVEAGLQSIQSQALLYSVTWILYLLSDLLFAAVFVALYFALKLANRRAMVVGVVLNSLFVVLDVALDIPLRLSLVSLAASYSAAQLPAQQASVSAAAQTVMNSSNLVALVATVLQFSAVIISSLVMLKSGAFMRVVSYVGIVCGVVAILFIPAFVGGGAQLAGLFNIGGFVLLVVWSMGAGLRLRKLANLAGSTPPSTPPPGSKPTVNPA
jgi:hypothetical protein